jgi:hypothetical protein
MATEPDGAYVMDLALLLKALRETQQGATQVVQQLHTAEQTAAQVGQQFSQRLQTLQAFESHLATAMTKAVQQATAALKQEQARTVEQVGAEIHRQHEGLLQAWEHVVDHAVHLRQWLPWKVALLLLGGTLLVNAGAAAWWGWQLATERREARQATALASELNRYLRETLYAQLPATHKQAIDTIYRAQNVPSPGKRLP